MQSDASHSKLRVLIVGHSLCPEKGSEPGLTWNWAWYLSALHEIWVIAHPEFREEVESYLMKHPNSRMHIVWLKGSDWDPSRGQRGVRLHYLKWLSQSVEVARQLHAEAHFDIIHHVSLATVSAPPKLWRLGVPFVWGPMGGAQICPFPLVHMFGRQSWLEYVRWVRVSLLRFLPALRTTAARSAAVLASNEETISTLRAAGATEPLLFPDNGIPDHAFPDKPIYRNELEVVRVLWAGKFEKRKALPLALEAIRRISQDVRLELYVAGKGEENDSWRSLSTSMGLDRRVHFLGELGSAQMREQFRIADIFLFTSIRDSCASVVLEAMSYGLPVVTLDLHGVGDYMPQDAGIKVPVGSREETVQSIATALARMARDPQLRRISGLAGWEYARQLRWSKRAEKMDRIYQQCIATRTDDLQQDESPALRTHG